MVLAKKRSRSTTTTRRAKVHKHGLKARQHRHHTGAAREVRKGMRVHCKDSDYKHLKRALKAHKHLKLGHTSKSGFRKVVRRTHKASHGKKSGKKRKSRKSRKSRK